MKIVRLAAGAVALAMLLSAAPIAHAQSAVDRLRRQLAASPEDARLRCEVGWAEFHAGDLVGARDHLDGGIHGFGEPREPALRRRLGACLYSYGRLAEAQGDATAAIVHYAQSLQWRFDDARTRERFEATRDAALAHRRDPASRSAHDRALAAVREREDNEAEARLGWLGAPNEVAIEDVAGEMDGPREAILANVWQDDEQGSYRELTILIRNGSRWTTVPLEETPILNGDVIYRFGVVSLPGARAWTTFVVRKISNERCREDEEGMPNWHLGSDTLVVWREGAWRSVWNSDPPPSFDDDVEGIM